jgi:hypothetical protein
MAGLGGAILPMLLLLAALGAGASLAVPVVRRRLGRP